MWVRSIASLLVFSATAVSAQTTVGNLRTLDHQVAGEVVILNDQVLEIRNFVYDGQGRTLFAMISSLCIDLT